VQKCPCRKHISLAICEGFSRLEKGWLGKRKKAEEKYVIRGGDESELGKLRSPVGTGGILGKKKGFGKNRKRKSKKKPIEGK